MRERITQQETGRMAKEFSKMLWKGNACLSIMATREQRDQPPLVVRRVNDSEYAVLCGAFSF